MLYPNKSKEKEAIQNIFLIASCVSNEATVKVIPHFPTVSQLPPLNSY